MTQTQEQTEKPLTDGVVVEEFNKRFVTAFETLSVIVYERAKEKGWYDEPREDGTAIALMHSELSEGLEALRKELKSDHIPDYLGIEEELADVVIRIMDFSKHRGLNVARAIIAKTEFNATRPHKHGGKKF